MSSLVDYAESELKLIGMGADTKDPMNLAMHDNLIAIVKTFSSQGHSGFSAGYALSLLQKLMNYEPLTPIEDKPDQWVDHGDVLQHKRAFSVFKDKKTGETYDSNGKVFVRKGDPSDAWTGEGSRVPITFPYTPKIEYVEVEKDD